VVEVDGWPAASDRTRLYIAEKACAFDRKHHPDVLPGSAWLQKGFTSSDADLADWQVDTSTCTFKYADTAPPPAA
jgi:hypothetical protein